MSKTTKQHIIPASYIAGFSNLPKKKLRKSELWFCSTKYSKPFLKSARNRLYEDKYFEIDTQFFGVDPNLYGLEEDDIINFVEKQQQDIEGEFLRIKEIIRNNLISLSQEDNQLLIHYMIHLHMRTTRKRKEICEIYSKEISKKFPNSGSVSIHRKELISKGLDSEKFDECLSEKGLEIIGNTMASKSVLGYKNPDIFYQAEMDRFGEYTFDFCRTTNSEEFISGDHPVVIGKRCIIFPLDKKLCLVGMKQETPLNIDLINRAIASNSEKEIFGSTESVVSKYKECLDIKDTFSLRHLDEELYEHAIYEEYSRSLLSNLMRSFV